MRCLVRAPRHLLSESLRFLLEEQNTRHVLDRDEILCYPSSFDACNSRLPVGAVPDLRLVHVSM